MSKGNIENLRKGWEAAKGRPARNRGMPHTKEAREKMSLARIGKEPWNKGKKTGFAPWLGKKRPEISEKLKGHPFYPGSEKGWFKKGTKPWNTGIKALQLSGPNHHNWKGGITPVLLQIRHLFEYRQWRSDVFQRDDFTCQLCGERGGRLEADHFPKTFAEIIHENGIKNTEDALVCEELWNINNGRTLCAPCHWKTPTHGRRKKKL